MIDPNTFPADWQPLDEKDRNTIIGLTATGCSRPTAAGFVGCTPDDIRRTALVNQKFATALAHAESLHVNRALRTITQAADENKNQWRAAAWLLERCYPERFGRRGAKTVTPPQMEELINIVRDVVNSHVPDPQTRAALHNVFATRVKAVLYPDEGEIDAT